MGFLDKLINDAAEELKKKAEEAKNQMIQNMKNQVDGILGTDYGSKGKSYFSSSNESYDNDVDDYEPNTTQPEIQPASASVLPDTSTVTEEKTSQGMFSERLEAMIEAVLQDGVLTQKEREVILRRAEKEGEDLDEFEIMFDARLSQLGIKVEESTTEEPSDIQTPEDAQDNSQKGPDGMFSERLEFLIHNAIEDGQITEKERNVIIRRAQAEGEDLDEVDIYIQSLLQKQKMGEL